MSSALKRIDGAKMEEESSSEKVLITKAEFYREEKLNEILMAIKSMNRRGRRPPVRTRNEGSCREVARRGKNPFHNGRQL